MKRKTKDEENHTLKNHSNYYINDRKEAMKFKMIDTLDDLLPLKKEDAYKLSLKDNDLNRFVFNLKGAGYEPQIRYGAGKISEIKMSLKFKKGKDDKPVVYSIESQDLDKDKIDEDIMVNTEDKYNRVSEEMFKFHRKSFNEAHKSYYNETDVIILDECRTIVANGRIHGTENVSLNDRCSIDIRKAFTHSTRQIVKIPVFRDFDVYRPYGLKSDFNRLGDYTLYIVKACQGNIFVNKTFNLVYGLHLKKLMKRGVNMKILYYKVPSCVHKVKYGKAIEELYKAKMSGDEEENNKINKKKTIANVIFGLLEKGYNKKSVSRIFDNAKEALKHRDKHGGKTYILHDDEKWKSRKNGKLLRMVVALNLMKRVRLIL